MVALSAVGRSFVSTTPLPLKLPKLQHLGTVTKMGTQQNWLLHTVTRGHIGAALYVPMCGTKPAAQNALNIHTSSKSDTPPFSRANTLFWQNGIISAMLLMDVSRTD